MSDLRVSVTRRIAAPAHDLFLIVSRPSGHVAIDGSGMLVAAPDDRALTAVGDTFDMDMDREPLGDLPMGKYKVRNTVTKLTPDSELEWNIGGIDMPPVGHVYGYTLAAVGDETDVTLYCDWSGAPDALKQAREWPIVPVHMLEKSMDNLERLVKG